MIVLESVYPSKSVCQACSWLCYSASISHSLHLGPFWSEDLKSIFIIIFVSFSLTVFCSCSLFLEALLDSYCTSWMQLPCLLTFPSYFNLFGYSWLSISVLNFHIFNFIRKLFVILQFFLAICSAFRVVFPPRFWEYSSFKKFILSITCFLWSQFSNFVLDLGPSFSYYKLKKNVW